MSRLAQAYRRSRGGPFGRQLDYALPLAESWITTEVPWDLGQSAVPDRHGPSRPPLVATAPAVPDRATPRNRAGERRATAPRDELLPLAQRILRAGSGERPIRSLLFAAINRESSAEVCAGTAAALACQITGSVCVLDTNLRSPSLAHVFGVDGTTDPSDLPWIKHELRRCLVRVSSNLWLLPADQAYAEAVSLSAGQPVRQVLDELRSAFDYVLLEAAPVSVCSDAITIGSAVDGVVLVVAANATRREVAKNAAQHLTEANVNIFGAVLTDREFPIPEAIYRRL
jgi:protein-tyrosine kinase